MPVAGALLQRLVYISIEGRISTGDSAEGGSDEAAANTDRLIRETRERYEGRDVTALLGTTGAGKTVATALIKHTLSARWIPNSRGRWEAQMDSGHDDVNKIIRKMQEGYFPSPALKDSCPSLAISIHRMTSGPRIIELVLHGMSGENYRDYLTEPGSANVDEMLSDLLAGDGAYIAHATKYVLMIDCEEADHWDTDKPQAVNMLKKITAIKKRRDCVDRHGRLMSPIGLVFTKADMLSGDRAKKNASALAREYPDLMSSLRISHSGPLAYFKVHARVADDGDNLDARAGASTNPGGDGRSREGGGEEVQAEPEKRLAVPLDYSVSEYHKLISWLVDTR